MSSKSDYEFTIAGCNHDYDYINEHLHVESVFCFIKYTITVCFPGDDIGDRFSDVDGSELKGIEVADLLLILVYLFSY